MHCVILSLLVAACVARPPWPKTDCAPCRCYLDRGRHADCSSLNLESVPTLPVDVQHLNLANNKLTEIPDELGSYMALDSLVVSGNPLTTLALKPRLETLVVTGIRFQSIDQITVTNRERLENIVGLHVEEAEGRPFAILKDLKNLDIRIGSRNISEQYLDGLSLEKVTMTLDNAEIVPELLLNSSQITMRVLTVKGPNILEISPRLVERLSTLKVIDLDLPSMPTIHPDLLHGEIRYAAHKMNLPADIKAELENMMDTLSHPTILERITLRNIHTLPEGLFSDIYTLRRITLKGITVIPENLFNLTVKLDNLDLSYNNITKVSPAWFSKTKIITVVNMSHNAIDDVPRGTFGETQIECLDLSHNRIKELDASTLYHMRNSLYYLNLSHNVIESFPSDVFKDMSSIRSLHMNNNGLLVIKDLSFKDLSDLEYLYLQLNNLTSINSETFEGLRNLVFLDLSYNNISDIAEDSLNDVTSLKHLDLQQNSIVHLPSRLIDLNDRLQTIYLDGNDIHCDCSVLDFKNSLQNLMERGINLSVTCISPDHYKGQNLVQTDIDEDSCQTTTDAPASTAITTMDTTAKVSTDAATTAHPEVPIANRPPSVTETMGVTAKGADITKGIGTVTVQSSKGMDTVTVQSPKEIGTVTVQSPSFATVASSSEAMQQVSTNVASSKALATYRPVPPPYIGLGIGGKLILPRNSTANEYSSVVGPSTPAPSSGGKKRTPTSSPKDDDKAPPPPIASSYRPNGKSTYDYLLIFLWVTIAVLSVAVLLATYFVTKMVKKAKESNKNGSLVNHMQDTSC